ncbi:4Fe-4S dicluster domain-containing protein, partial [Vibrio rotiferianus]
ELTPYFSQGKDVEHSVSFVKSNPVKVRTPDSVCDDPAKVREVLLGHPVWSEYDSRCIGCGRCTSSCPTCACFNVFDVVYNQEAKVGERRRQHASCMIDGFSDMAGGHSFRHKTGERLRYRALHKVNDFKSRQGEHHMCVGCGRCDDRCPHYISFSNIINKMTSIVEEAL